MLIASLCKQDGHGKEKESLISPAFPLNGGLVFLPGVIAKANEHLSAYDQKGSNKQEGLVAVGLEVAGLDSIVTLSCI